jgi:hypothetical protein
MGGCPERLARLKANAASKVKAAPKSERGDLRLSAV